jgi:dTMP kinase
MSKSSPRGRFIVFEGTEGAGKTTQLNHLYAWLKTSGWWHRLQTLQPEHPPLLFTREPGGTALGRHLRRLLLDSELMAAEGLPEQTELLLYAADRSQHVQTVLEPALAKGTLVLCDRYTDSTVAYQGYGRGLDLALIQQLNAIATQGLVSDLTLWLDLDVQQGLTRAQQRPIEAGLGNDRMEAAALAFHQRVQQGFAALAKAEPHRIIRIDANADATQVAQTIQLIVEQRLAQWYPKLSEA